MDNKNLKLENLFIMDSNPDKKIDNSNFVLPVSTSLNFEFLIDHIKKVAQDSNEIKSSFAKSIVTEFEKTPDLHGKIYDVQITKKYESLINNMMMFVFPESFWEVQTYAAYLPYSNDLIFSTKKFRELNFKWDEAEGELNIDQESLDIGKVISAFAMILNKFYGVKINLEFPIVYKIMDPETGLDKYYKMNSTSEFVDIVPKRELKKLTPEDIEHVKSNIYDLELVSSIIEPENYEFTGLIATTAVNISDTEILSSIRKDLIEKDIITSYSGFLKLQHKIKSLLKCPGLLLGITVYPGSKERLSQEGHKFGNSFLMNDNCKERLGSLNNSIYAKVLEAEKAIVIEDLSKYPDKSPIEEEIMQQGINNIFIAPLKRDNKIVGLIEIGSPGVGMINMVNSLKLGDVLTLFAIAVERSSEEMKSNVQAVIKNKCTAIHTSLEWKFRNAALNYIKKNNEGNAVEMEEIVFKEVYPLYGLSDIRNSSMIRNQAIREDLIENLELAGKVLHTAKSIKQLKIFDELKFRIEKKINALKFGIDSGDEAETLKFLNKKVIPVFDHIQHYGKEVKKSIEEYNDSLNANLRFVYKRRKKYDESSMKITGFIASILDEEQKYIQEMYPHYFERFKTDGVDHNIYIGESLVEDRKFNMLYLRNIRMWQLMMMSGIVKKLDILKNDLQIPLETAHLILVQDNPLSIRFRYDEKRFDVDGAYNIRYEIMKKRIDKAEIKGKEERLTQPEKIAIVYSQTSEANEYIEYIEFLQSQGYLKKEIEELELEDLQGIKGLKALRVSVDLDKSIKDPEQNSNNLKKAMKKLSYN